MTVGAELVIAGTGHRPDKLGGYSEDVFQRLVDLALAELDARRPTRAISGMALGWDQALAEACARYGVPFVVAVPCDGQERMWPQASQLKYRRLLGDAAEVVVVCPGPYAGWKMQRRNEWMVDHASEVWALWDGSPGGTKNCVDYAARSEVLVINLWDAWKER
jgi:uncharacterized phage-like protein YoqJ